MHQTVTRLFVGGPNRLYPVLVPVITVRWEV